MVNTANDDSNEDGNTTHSDEESEISDNDENKDNEQVHDDASYDEDAPLSSLFGSKKRKSVNKKSDNSDTRNKKRKPQVNHPNTSALTSSTQTRGKVMLPTKKSKKNLLQKKK